MSIMDWDALNASDVPKWLVALCSKDEKCQLQAKMDLAGYLKQHALALNTASCDYNEVLATDAPVLITSFLIEMLKDPSVARPASIAELLEIVASYRREPTLGQPQRERAAKIFELVAREFDLYLDMLKTADDFEARVYLMNVLSQIPERQDETTNALLKHLKAHPVLEDLETLTAIDTIFRAVRTVESEAIPLKKDFIETLNQYFERTDMPKTVLARAACYLMFLQEDVVSQKVINTLLVLLKETNPEDHTESLVLDEFWIDALLTRGTHQATHLFLDIFDHHKAESFLIEIAGMLLELHFGSGDVHSLYFNMYRQDGDELRALTFRDEDRHSITSQPENLSDIQKEVLRHFVRKDQIWAVKTNLLEFYALPSTRSGLERLID